MKGYENIAPLKCPCCLVPVTPELMKDVIDRCLESLKPKFEENLPLHEQMKEAFAELRAKIYVPSKNAEEGAAAGGEADAPAADV